MKSWAKAVNVCGPDKRSMRLAIRELKARTSRKDRRTTRHVLRDDPEEIVLPKKMTSAWELS